MNSIGKILQDRRKELGLTQPDVHKELKQFGYSMNHAAISSWERNVTQPERHTVSGTLQDSRHYKYLRCIHRRIYTG